MTAPDGGRTRTGSGLAAVPRQTEDAFLAQVMGYCTRKHLRAVHIPKVRVANGRHMTAVSADGRGFVDILIVGPGGDLFWELKVGANTTSPDQVDWHDDLAAAGLRVRVVRPRDWEDGTAQAELDALAAPTPTCPRLPSKTPARMSATAARRYREQAAKARRAARPMTL